jgi:hypothetical protein
MRPLSTVRRARAVGVLASMLLPLAIGVVACGGGDDSDSRADAGSADAGTAGTASADTGAASTVSTDTGGSGSVSDATAKWCTAFRSVDQSPATADQASMLAVAAPRDDLESAWSIIVLNHDKLHTPEQDEVMTDRYRVLKTFADTYCPG